MAHALHSRRHLFGGGLYGLGTEGVMVAAALLTLAYLTRTLGPESYGLFSLAVSIVAWVQWSTSAAFSRTTFKLIAETEPWQPLATGVMRLHLLVGSVAAVLVIGASGPIASALGEPALGRYLALLALDIPLFSLAHAQRNILGGLSRFRERAFTGSGRWLSRVALIVVLVELGFSVEGAILGSLGASVVEFALGRWYLRAPLVRGPALIGPRFWEYAAPVLLFALSTRLFDRLGLVMLKVLDAPIALVGMYAAAQNLALAPGLTVMAVAPVILATLSRLAARQEHERARAMVHECLRWLCLLVPFVGVLAAAAPDLVPIILGARYADGAVFLTVLLVGAFGSAGLSLGTAMLVAGGKPRLTAVLGLPLLPLSLIGYLLAIPVWGGLGAAFVTASVATLAGAAALAAVALHWRVRPSLRTLAWSALVVVGATTATALWPVEGVLELGVKLAVVGPLIPMAYIVLREFSQGEITAARYFTTAALPLSLRNR